MSVSVPLKNLSLVSSVWLFTCWSAMGESLKFPQDQLYRLLELCTSNAAPVEVNEAMQQLTGKPTGIYPDHADQNPEGARRYGELILQRLGLTLLTEPSSISAGLPSLKAFPHPERLGPLFSGMVPYSGDKTDLKITLGPLEKSITEDWMEAAVRCSAFDFIHSIHACRDQTSEVLLNYQNTGNETGILRLGEMVGLHPMAAKVIRPESFTSRTLALLLAGALGVQGRYEHDHYLLMKMAVSWGNTHPSLYDEWSSMVSNAAVLPWYDVVSRFRNKERAEALLALSALRKAPGIIATLNPLQISQSKQSLLRMDQNNIGGFMCSLLTSAACPEEELPALARVIPTDLLAAAIGKMLAYGSTDDEAQWRGVLLISELKTRKDLPDPLPIYIRRDDALEIARRWLEAGHAARSQRLIEASEILKP